MENKNDKLLRHCIDSVTGFVALAFIIVMIVCMINHTSIKVSSETVHPLFGIYLATAFIFGMIDLTGNILGCITFVIIQLYKGIKTGFKD